MYVRDGRALEDDVEERAAIGDEEEGHHGPLRIDVDLAVLGDPDEHEGDGELDRDDGGAVEDLEQEKVQEAQRLVLLRVRLLHVREVDADAVETREDAGYGEHAEG